MRLFFGTTAQPPKHSTNTDARAWTSVGLAGVAVPARCRVGLAHLSTFYYSLNIYLGLNHMKEIELKFSGNIWEVFGNTYF